MPDPVDISEPEDMYGQILRLIPREPQVDVDLGLTVEESNAVQWANAYYHQLTAQVETVDPVKSDEPILSLCEQIQKLVGTDHPDDPTDDFLAIYGNNPEMCRTYNYFNKKIREMGELTRAKTPSSTSAETGDVTRKVSSKVSSDTSVVSTDSLDTLALKFFESEKNRLDQLALDYYEKEKTRLDQLALAHYENENIDRLDQLALEKYNP